MEPLPGHLVLTDQAFASSATSTSRVCASNRSCVLQLLQGTVFSLRLPAGREGERGVMVQPWPARPHEPKTSSCRLPPKLHAHPG